MKESLSGKIFGESGEVSWRREVGLVLKSLTLSFRYPLDLNKRTLEGLRLMDELRQLANEVEMKGLQKQLESTKPSQ